MADADGLFERAMRAGAARNYAKAAELLSEIVRGTDAMPKAFLYLGRAYHALGRFGPAVSAFRAFLASAEPGGEDEAAALFFLGRTLLAWGQPERALSTLEAANRSRPDDSRVLAILGVAALKARKSGRAVEALERAVTIDPGDERVRRAYANALLVHAIRRLDRGDADMARQMLSWVIANGGDGNAARVHRARAYRELGRHAEAAADYETLARSNPSDPSLRLQLAAALFAAGSPDRAWAEIERLKAAGLELPDARWDDLALAGYHAWRLLSAGEYRLAAREAVDILKRSPDDANARFVAAESYRSLGAWDKAANHYRKLAERDRSAPEPCLGLAAALYGARDFPGAAKAAALAGKRGAATGDVAYFTVLCAVEDPDAAFRSLLDTARQAVRARPSDAAANYALGVCHYKCGRPDLARTWFSRSLEADPDREMSLLYMISCAESLGDEEGALRAYGEYLSRYPDNMPIRRDYVRALSAAGEHSLAADAIEAGFAFETPSRQTMKALASRLRLAGRWKDAVTKYRELLREDPSDIECLLALAYGLERSGAADSAVALLERARTHFGTVRDLEALLGVFLARAGREEDGLAALRRAAEADPADGRAWYNMGRIHEAAGRHDVARMCFRNAESSGYRGSVPEGLVDSAEPTRQRAKKPPSTKFRAARGKKRASS